jgi:TLD
LSFQLTEAFATKCLEPIELYSFKTVFKKHATASSGLTYWTQTTLTEFLGLPQSSGLPIAHVIFQLASYLGAYPFPSQAPAILTNDALLRVVVILTGRYSKVIRAGKSDWERQIWRGLAVIDRDLESKSTENLTQPGSGFAVDQARDEPDEDDEEDGLLLAAFDAMDAADAFKHGEQSNVAHAMIPTDNFLTLIMFLLLIAPLAPQEPLSKYTGHLTEDMLQDARQDAYAILASFGVERNPGISYRIFRKVLSSTLMNLFSPLTALFEHFFFASDFDLSTASRSRASVGSVPAQPAAKPAEDTSADRITMPEIHGDLLTPSLLSHISFMLPPSTLFGNLTLLYSGASSGFSMPTFQSSVFNWQSPTILLVAGTILDTAHPNPSSRAFLSSIPFRRFKSSALPGQRVVYGAYIPVPWKQTHKTSFGNQSTLMFQLFPQHDLFPGSPKNSSYVYFCRYPSSYTGIGFGSPLAENNNTSSTRSSARRRSSFDNAAKIPLGPVSLHVDDSLTYAVFTNDSRGGGSFVPSKLPTSCRLEPTKAGPFGGSAALTSPVTSPPISPVFRTGSPSRLAPVTPPLVDWQDAFEIEALEIYGLGNAEVAEEQKRARQWEEREAERRRTINLKTGDLDADRELLKLAGLIGEGRSGGSMG